MPAGCRVLEGGLSGATPEEISEVQRILDRERGRRLTVRWERTMPWVAAFGLLLGLAVPDDQTGVGILLAGALIAAVFVDIALRGRP